MPLWLTECGRPWKKGPKRPEIAEDWISAVDIAMKGVESRCCGVERYFPFVYPYYEENENNFGIMDKFGTPTRAFAAYAQSIRMLADTEYLGDLKIDDPAVFRARVFAKGNEAVLVLCSGKLTERKIVTVPGKVLGVVLATGEETETITLDSECMIYVRLERKSIESLLNTETAAMKLYRPSQERWTASYSATPVVLRYQFDKERVATAPQGYTIRRTEEKTLPITVRVFNLQTEQVTCPIRFTAAGSMERREVVVPAQGFVDTVWNLPLNIVELTRGDSLIVRIDIDGTDNSLAIPFRGSATWDGIRSTVETVTNIPVGDMKCWTKNAAGICTSVLEKPSSEEQAVWRMFASFGDGDRWVYPRFEIPQEIDLSKGDGLILWARCIGNARASFMLFEQNGSGYIVAPAIKNDGDWHIVKLPFDRFTHVGATRPDPNGKLDLDQVCVFSFGANCNSTNCVLELKKVALYTEKQ